VLLLLAVLLLLGHKENSIKTQQYRTPSSKLSPQLAPSSPPSIGLVGRIPGCAINPTVFTCKRGSRDANDCLPDLEPVCLYYRSCYNPHPFVGCPETLTEHVPGCVNEPPSSVIRIHLIGLTLNSGNTIEK